MDMKSNRRNSFEYLKEFKSSIPHRKQILGRDMQIDSSKLYDVKDKISLFFDRGILVSPMLVDKNNIDVYKEDISLVKQFTSDLKPENLLENKIMSQTSKSRSTRRILIPTIIEDTSSIMEDYNKMIAYYMLMGGDKPVERFSSVEMSMKQYGIKPDIGMAIMKYGDEITRKLEEVACERTKSKKEWEFFKTEVLHCFNTAENIGNRSVNPQEHLEWEERLVRLGILERRLNKGDEEQEKFKKTIEYDKNKVQVSRDEGEGTVSLETALQRNAQAMYENTGMIPLGYKKDKEGKIVRIQPVIEKEKIDRLSASRDNLSATNKNKQQIGVNR